MTQHSFNIPNESGAEFRADANAALQALASNSAGVSPPATTYAYQWWADTTSGLLRQRNSLNSAWITRGTLAEIGVLARNSNAVLGVGDYGKTIIGTGTFTQTFASAGVLSTGWLVNYRNAGAGVITLDPNASEVINDATTLALSPGDSCTIFCDGTALYALGLRVPMRGAVLARLNPKDIPSSVITTIDWDVEEIDNGGWHDSTVFTTRLQVPAGVSYVNVTFRGCFSTSNVGTLRYAAIRRNGGATTCAETRIPPSGAETPFCISTGPLAVTTDYFTAEVFQDSGQVLTVGGGGYGIELTRFAIQAL